MTTPHYTYKTLADVRAANRATDNHWFSRPTMRFFNTVIHGGLRRGRYFITSESDMINPRRLFTIREAMPDGSINTVGGFQAYRTLSAARAVLAEIIKKEGK